MHGTDNSTGKKDLSTELHDLLFGARRSIRYHNRRRLFFDRFHTISTFLTALSGTATFALVLSGAWPWVILVCACLVAVFSIIDLVVGTARAAREHNDLARRFFKLEKAVNKVSDPTSEDLITLKGRRLDIEADEPPPLKILDSMCHNELLRAMGYEESHFVKITWPQRLLSQFFDFREHTCGKA